MAQVTQQCRFEVLDLPSLILLVIESMADCVIEFAEPKALHLLLMFASIAVCFGVTVRSRTWSSLNVCQHRSLFWRHGEVKDLVITQ